MKGAQTIRLTFGKVRYDLTLRRKYTIIKGESGTGKTTLYSYLRELRRGNKAVHLYSSVPCLPVSAFGEYWKQGIEETHNSIVVIDEDSLWVKGSEFSHIAKYSDNYFLIINRDPLPRLPYSVKEVYEIHASGKFHTLRPYYSDGEGVVTPDSVVVEDSGSGLDFFENLLKNCEPAKSNTKVYGKVLEAVESGKSVLAIADGAAFGPHIDKIVDLKAYKQCLVRLFLPESFEYLLLRERFGYLPEVQDVLQHTEDYADTSYVSWEDFYTQYLVQLTKGTAAAYTKNELSPGYLGPCCSSKRCALMQREGVHDPANVLKLITNVDFTKIRK